MEYSLYDCMLTKDNPHDKLGKVTNQKPRGFKKLLDDLTGPGSILKETESKAVIDKYWETITQYVSEGYAYHDDYISVNLDIAGVFEDENDRFDPLRHSINVSIVPCNNLKAATQNIKPTYVEPNNEIPVIQKVYDWGTEKIDEFLTPGAALEIEGKALKIYEDVDGQGVFFINKADGVETKGSMPKLNEPKKLSLKVPALNPGEYRIEIRNTTRNGKSLRIGISTAYYTVQ
ncbi:DNA-binding domain-containing protein [Marinifilum sp.]|uniref:DNA-binding domain-containing protein n=1 Tax=Marinifilum sp. TaxID=2033137 RepID=UPI003BADAE3A